MKVFSNRRSVCLLIGLCLVFSVAMDSSVVEAKKNKCEGTKKQRKQKMKERDLTVEQLEEMIAGYKTEIIADREQMAETAYRRLEREYEEHQKTGAPFVYDVLIISGGGPKGAFGSGFLEGWGTVTAPGFERPEFDAVTGVSTGALIAPFAFIGTDEAYSDVVDFYANPEPDWVKKRGWIPIWPTKVSMLNTCHLQDTIRESVDDSMVAAIAAGAAEDRLLLIGVTNLDVGAGRVLNTSRDAQAAVESENYDRIHSTLLASSAIPAAFPPVDIDGMYYADGGATSNLFITTFPGPDGPMARFRKRHPDAPWPKVRIWILVNQQLKPQHAVTRPRWLSVSGRALDTLTSATQLFALSWIKEMVEESRNERGIDVELHLMSIPMDAPKKTSKEMFDTEYMRALQELGRKIGADPAYWTDEIPSAYRVEGDWLESE